MAFDYRQEYHRYKLHYLKLQSLATQPLAQASLTVVASLLTVILLAIFAIKPTLSTIARLTKEIQDKEKVNKQLITKTKALQKAQTTYEQITPEIPTIETALPPEPEFVKLEQEIEYLAWQRQVLLASGNFTGFVVAGNEPEETRQKEVKKVEALAAKKINFNLIVGGRYQNLKEFIQDLENLDRLIVLESVNFTKDTEIEGAELQLTITATAFYKPKGVS